MCGALFVIVMPDAMHYTIDGVSGAGDAKEIFLAWLPSRNLAGMPPIQVPRIEISTGDFRKSGMAKFSKSDTATTL